MSSSSSLGAGSEATELKGEKKQSGLDSRDLTQFKLVPSNGSVAPAGTAASPAVASPLLFDRYRATRSAALKWELAYLALGVVDTAQTISCLNRGVCEEANPIFGRRPKTGTLIAAKAGVSILHFAGFKILQKQAPKYALRMAQISAITQGGVVALNARFAF